jgi:hypothetical protein
LRLGKERSLRHLTGFGAPNQAKIPVLHPAQREVYIVKIFAPLSILSLWITFAADAQIRFLDRLQPQTTSRWAVAASNARNGVASVSRRAKINLSQRDAALVMPHWTGSFRSQGVVYPFTVLGQDPALGTTTVIPTVIIPYRLILPDGGVFDASTDLIDGVTPVAGVVNSPLFQSVPWSAGSTQLGVTQFGDAAMRANFWSSIPGDRSGYHVLLAQPLVAPVQVITVPPGFGETIIDSAGTPLGVVDFGWLVNMTNNLTVALGVPPQVLAIHLMSAVEAVDLSGGTALGFHGGVFEGSAANPTLLPYIQTGYFAAHSALAATRPQTIGTGVLGHEIAELFNDPAADNAVPAWQDPAFSHLCDNSYYEVGDPLTRINSGIQVSLNGRSYHLPDVAFLPWFSGAQRSTSVNGWYSLANAFSTPAAACPVYTEFGSVGFGFAGFTSTVFTGVNNGANNQMQIAGYVTRFNAVAGFVLDFSLTPTLAFGNVREVYVPGSLVTVPSKINDRGEIAGVYVDAAGAEHGFLFSGGQYSTIDFPGAIATEALALNNWGVPAVAGDYVDSGGKVHGFVRIGGEFHSVDANFAVNLSVTGINDHAQMTGMYDLGGPLGVVATSGFTGTLGSLTPLNYPASALPTSTLPNSLNNQNEVAGQVKFQNPDFLQQDPFVEGGGNFVGIGGGEAFSAAAALGNNDAGILVGWFQNPDLGAAGAIAIPQRLLTGSPSQNPVQEAFPFQLRSWK